MEIEYIEKLVVDIFSKRLCVQEIYSLPNAILEYWLILDDVYSVEAAQCYEDYFCLLGQLDDRSDTDNYFDLRLLTPKELQSAIYLNPKKIWEREKGR